MHAKGRKVEIEVAETGCGITAEALGTILESFKQIDSADTRRSGGSGVGLVISGRQAHLHSIVGKGPCFSLALRKSGPDPAQIAASGLAAQ